MPGNGDPVIRTDSVTVRYGPVVAVNEVSLEIGRGELFGFLGPNGSGKTSLIKALCGLVKIAGGRATILGMDVARNTREIKRYIGYMSQRFGLYEDLTVSENIDFYAGVYNLEPGARRERRDFVIGLTGIAPYLERRAGALSGGWKQRLALACAIIHAPEVVFLDEPTAGIDPVARRALWDLLFQLSGQGVTFFVTTHYMDEAERCGRVGYIYLSRLVAMGTPEELKRMPEASPPGTMRVEIDCANASSTLTIVRELPYVREATIFGRAIHALVDARASEQALAAELARRGCANAEVRPVEPSLEDVFVTLTYRIMQDGARP
ncbi:MAG: ABC transporter ATP-binding protein [Acidobacteria bacterium]|nr:ABC transporter ATP-binding protein [Acidobacteriota bacterium]MBI3280965.1 ABC transporter ATP-binding protein [Acidobacteriota bacterium]